jgi:kynureninase
LYVGFEDVWRAVAHLKDVLDAQSWRDARFAVQNKVT